MKIFLVGPEYDSVGEYVYRELTTVKEVDWMGSWCFDGRPQQPTWNVEDALVTEEGTPKPRGDFPPLTVQALVLGQRAIAEIGSLAAECGELLPLRGLDGSQYSLLNAVPRYECVDEEQSQWRFGSSGRRLWIQRYAFLKDRLPPVSLFKAQASPTHLLATEGWLDERREFKAQVQRCGLRGLEFFEVWNDGGGEMPLVARRLAQ